jgi:hypothetical protein
MNKNNIKKIILKEMYGTSLRVLYEADEPADPTAPAPGAEPAPPAPDAAAPPGAPPPPGGDPTAPGAPPGGDPGALGGGPPGAPPDLSMPPMGGGLPPMGGPPGPPPGPPGAPPMGGPPGAPPKKENKPKPAKAPNPDKQQVASKLHTALMNAISSASQDISESLKKKSLRFLYEEDEKSNDKNAPKIDMEKYAGEVANLINNYTSLIDIKKSVITQAEQDLDTQFPNDGVALKKQLKDLLRTQYHLSLEKQNEPPETYAVGAKSGAGGPA